MTGIGGHCDPAFRGVRSAFSENFSDRRELGAAVCVLVGGRPVVDLWGGHRDLARRLPWERDTLVNAWSVGKGILACLVLTLVERGQLSLDEPVQVRWPEFAAEGKGSVSLRMLMSHRAGMPAIRTRLAEGEWQDWSAMCTALAAQEPWWEPGSDHGYHVNTYGFLVGELVRRATGRSPGHALREILGAPLDADFFWGVPESRRARVAEVDVPNVVLSEPAQWAQAFPPTGDAVHDTMTWHAYFNPPGLCGIGALGSDAWLRAEVPSTNGHATARGVALLYDALLRGSSDGTPWVGSSLLGEATTIHSDGMDRLLGRPSRFGLGFQLPSPDRPLGPSGAAFGHYGYGGQLGMADPAAGVVFAFLTSRPGDRWQTPRTQALVDAVYAAL
jgi:CubicO group peptidase (beta-lactamase class C family)